MVELYPYQKEALDTMYESEAFLLADEMGLGKTVSVLMEVRRRMETHDNMQVLIVCPKSVISVWESHIKWLIPEAVYGEPHVTITNYEQIRIRLEEFSKPFWTYVILDEAHYIKNRKTLRTKAVKKLKCKYKRALTGSPIINRPDELWSTLNWLDPQNYKSYWRFFNTFCEFYTDPRYGYKKVTGVRNVERLQEELSHFMLRRYKKDVLTELPDKYYTTIPVTLLPEQQRIYDEMRKEALAWVGQHEDEPVPAPATIAILTRLRMFAGAYAERDFDTGRVALREPSAKLDALMDILDDSEGSVVVFSMFRQMIDLASARLKETHSVLTGKTPQGERGTEVERFQDGTNRIFLGTIQAGGVGITLHRASTVVFLDRSWSPADNSQAEDRLHRIGQKNAVQVIALQGVNTVDLDIEKKLTLKWSWIKEILGG